LYTVNKFIGLDKKRDLLGYNRVQNLKNKYECGIDVVVKEYDILCVLVELQIVDQAEQKVQNQGKNVAEKIGDCKLLARIFLDIVLSQWKYKADSFYGVACHSNKNEKVTKVDMPQFLDGGRSIYPFREKQRVGTQGEN
jgi:hypothetical protein